VNASSARFALQERLKLAAVKITNITPAYPSGGTEYVKLYLKQVNKGREVRERKKFACKTKLFRAKATA